MNSIFKLMVGAGLFLTETSVGALAQDGSNLLLPPPTYNAEQINGAPGAQPVPQGGVATLAAPSEEKVPEGSIDDPAFREAMKIIAPMSPEQVIESRQQLDNLDAARGQPLTAVQPVTRSISVSMRPGELPPSIKVAPGRVSTLTFSDVTGQPWPVLSVTRGNPNAYEVVNSGPEGATNIITISAKQAWVPSNIAVTLVGAKVPLLMTLEPSANQVDFRVDAQIDQRGPNANYDVISSSGLAPTNDSVMLAFLDGVPPEGAQKLKVSDRDVEAWRYNDLLFVRTTRTMLSPAYQMKQSNVSGTNVYVLSEAPVLLMSDAGRMFSVQVQR